MPNWLKLELQGKEQHPGQLMSEEELDMMEAETDLMMCANDGSWLRAKEILEDMGKRKLKRRRSCWLSALNACAKVGRYEDAQDILRSMADAGVMPDHEAFHAAIEACEGQSVSDRVVDLMEDMRQRGLTPNVITYIKVIGMLQADGRSEDAMELYKEARSLGVLNPWNQNGRFLDLEPYDIPLAEVMIRSACLERFTQYWAGKKGFWVITGSDTFDRVNGKQKMVIKVMQDEFGLKIRLEPKRLGRLRVKGEELKRVAEERIMRGEQKYLGKYKRRRYGLGQTHVFESNYKHRTRPVEPGTLRST